MIKQQEANKTSTMKTETFIFSIQFKWNSVYIYRMWKCVSFLFSITKPPHEKSYKYKHTSIGIHWKLYPNIENKLYVTISDSCNLIQFYLNYSAMHCIEECGFDRHNLEIIIVITHSRAQRYRLLCWFGIRISFVD